jgi:hypothetical protein
MIERAEKIYQGIITGIDNTLGYLSRALKKKPLAIPEEQVPADLKAIQKNIGGQWYQKDTDHGPVFRLFKGDPRINRPILVASDAPEKSKTSRAITLFDKRYKTGFEQAIREKREAGPLEVDKERGLHYFTRRR